MASLTLDDFDGCSIDGLKFCSMVYAFFEEVRQTPCGISNLRRHRCDEKKLIEELLPICKYVQARYRLGRYISICWHKGDQKGDAEVVQTGFCIDQGDFPTKALIEVTCVMHGNEYLIWEHLDSGGGGFGPHETSRNKSSKEIISVPFRHRNIEFVQEFSKLVLKRINKKANNGYPDNTTLVVCCELDRLYTPDEWALLMDEVQKNLPTHTFQEIFVYDARSERACTFKSNQHSVALPVSEALRLNWRFAVND